MLLQLEIRAGAQLTIITVQYLLMLVDTLG